MTVKARSWPRPETGEPQAREREIELAVAEMDV